MGCYYRGERLYMEDQTYKSCEAHGHCFLYLNCRQRIWRMASERVARGGEMRLVISAMQQQWGVWVQMLYLMRSLQSLLLFPIVFYNSLVSSGSPFRNVEFIYTIEVVVTHFLRLLSVMIHSTSSSLQLVHGAPCSTTLQRTFRARQH